MTPSELASQLQFFKDIGVDTLDVSASRRREAPASLQSARAGDEDQMIPDASNAETLDSIRLDIGDCKRCKLAPSRTNIVFGSGNPHAELVFVGEAPGFD